ncbi:hypothetical protein VP01_544g2 [Puccinia sorghi]|uniref:Uncharacterized protein n=1 Tax=Puccinia sorghi TaxID=27349 RepID=A0A0L6UJL3_9BASI|nr:hypothetical protein VP01_544g2 [Puccinia sorghi]
MGYCESRFNSCGALLNQRLIVLLADLEHSQPKIFIKRVPQQVTSPPENTTTIDSLAATLQSKELLKDWRSVTVEEQLVIFLDIVVNNNAMWQWPEAILPNPSILPIFPG